MLRHLARHWRGELPLAVAWWVNGIALSACLLALNVVAANSGMLPAIDTRLRFTVYLAVGTAFLLILPAWQVIGIFRAADRHAEQVGTILAARLTQVLTTLLTLLLAIRFLIFAGEAVAGARIAYSLGDTPYSVNIDRSGRIIEVRGAFLFGLSSDVERLLTRNPHVRRIRLNSGGGSLSEARKLRALIHRYGLDTDSTRECSSACVSAYMGGHHRLLHRAARMGFHLPRNPGFGLRSPLTQDYAAELAWFARQGVPPWFRARWIESGRRFWFPSPAQLSRAGIVHAFHGEPKPGEAFYYR